MKIRQFVHEYKGYGGAESECRFEFYKTPTGMTVAIATELPSNAGTPIREFSEHLATQAYRLVFSPNVTHIGDFLYIEHGPKSRADIEYLYALVDFDWEEEGEQFIHPRRTVLTKEEVLTLIGEDEAAKA